MQHEDRRRKFAANKWGGQQWAAPLLYDMPSSAHILPGGMHLALPGADGP